MNWLRILQHIPHGLAVVLLCCAHWSLAIAFVWLFIRYEQNEDRHLWDEAWKDIAGALVGLVLGGSALLVVELVCEWECSL